MLMLKVPHCPFGMCCVYLTDTLVPMHEGISQHIASAAPTLLCLQTGFLNLAPFDPLGLSNDYLRQSEVRCLSACVSPAKRICNSTTE